MLPNKETTSYSISAEDNLGNTDEKQYSISRLVGMGSLQYAHELLVGSGAIYQNDGTVYYNGELSYSFANSLSEDLSKGVISKVDLHQNRLYCTELTRRLLHTLPELTHLRCLH